MAHTFSPSPQEAEAGGISKFKGSLEFQDSQDCVERSRPKTEKRKEGKKEVYS